MRSAVAKTEVHAAAGCHRRQSRMAPAFAGDAGHAPACGAGRTPDAVRTSKPTTYSDIDGANTVRPSRVVCATRPHPARTDLPGRDET